MLKPTLKQTIKRINPERDKRSLLHLRLVETPILGSGDSQGFILARADHLTCVERC